MNTLMLFLTSRLGMSLIGVAVLFAKQIQALPKDVSFVSPRAPVAAYDSIEITANVVSPDAQNPFTDASLRGRFELADGSKSWEVEGFADSEDGAVYRLRFMPPAPGNYRYSASFHQGSFEKTSNGQFQAVEAHRRGPIRVDRDHPWHFVWEGTREHYFFNGTTAYFLVGWRDERTIRYSLERLHRLKVNRMRVTIAGREDIFFGEPVMNSSSFTTYPEPWPARKANDMYHPDFDYKRFHVAYWQKFDRALEVARANDMIISLVLDMNDNKVHPEAGSEDEHRFIHYAIARFGAFSNITWDLGDDLENYRSDEWTRETGTLIKKWDPYQHLATSHPIKDVHQDRVADWFDFTSFQEWSRNQHSYILRQREAQKKAGRIIPQTNEEYGYEDHYPLWAEGLGSESADTLRRTAWDIYMAGGYQTAGESARRGTNIWPDTGGGWLNGRGDDTMTMFLGYGHIVDFFSEFHWWETDPHDELVDTGNYCLAKPGEIYAVYLPKGGLAKVQLQPGVYKAQWYGALTGEWIPLPEANGPVWTSPKAPDQNDWALLLTRNH